MITQAKTGQTTQVLLNKHKSISSLIAAASVSRFDSMYESFQALTSIQVSHFVEWFSGSDISAIWTKSNYVGTGTFAMSDEIDGGYSITTAATASRRSGLDFNDVGRHLDPTGCILIGICKNVASSSRGLDFGFGNAKDTTATSHRAIWEDWDSESFKSCATNGTRTNSDLPNDEDWTLYKVECKSASCEFSADGVLKVTITTNLPTLKGQPTCLVYTSENVAKEMRIRYYEAYNTSITINSSLYERLSALTQVMNQRVVETFQGAAIQSDRWNLNDIAGSGSVAMTDSIDGGLTLTTGATDNNRSCIAFNNKRQYDSSNCAIISVMKRISSISANVGFSNVEAMNDNMVLMKNDFDDTYINVLSYASASGSETDSDIAIDTAWHVYKGILTTGNFDMYVDGVLKVSKTTDIPTTDMQPSFYGISRATGAQTCSIRYLEAYNKLTTETDYPSVYEMFNPLTTIAKSHFWEWFDGNNIDTDRWDISGTVSIVDAINGGLSQTSTSGGTTCIDFAEKRQFDPRSCNFISVTKITDTTNNRALFGIKNGAEITTTNSTSVRADVAVDTEFGLQSDLSTSESTTYGTVSVDTNWHSFKIECGASDNKLYIDGVLDITKSSDLPTVKMQPYSGCYDLATGGKSIAVRYLEVKNV